jgi:hypothetical protein
MVVKIVRLIVAILVVLTAWTVGNLHGQNQVAEFEIYIRSPHGRTNLYCTKGCTWKETWFECGGNPPQGCGSQYHQNGLFQAVGAPWQALPPVIYESTLPEYLRPVLPKP